MKIVQFLSFLDQFDSKFKTPFIKQKQIKQFFPDESIESFKISMSRLVKNGIIKNLTRGLYFNPRSRFYPKNFLETLAINLRNPETFYLSLESILSEHGIISQIPNRLVFISQNRSQEFVTSLGIIEFVHGTNINPRFDKDIILDPNRCIYVATPERALKDAYKHRRFIDLIEEQREKLL